MNDLIADMLARIQNAIMRNKEFVSVLNTNINRDILKVLKKEEMIKDFKLNEDSRTVDVELLYENKEPVISKLQRVSKPGQRIYVTKKEIKPIMNGRGISIISTSKGLMSEEIRFSRLSSRDKIDEPLYSVVCLFLFIKDLRFVCIEFIA